MQSVLFEAAGHSGTGGDDGAGSASCEAYGHDDKENTGAVGAEKRGKGSSNGGADGFGAGSVGDRQLSGQKRGGYAVEIEKQKSFTGSYFQVSGGGCMVQPVGCFV